LRLFAIEPPDLTCNNQTTSNLSGGGAIDRSFHDLKRTMAVNQGGSRLSEVTSKNLELAHPD
jgi:hypothetical protein